MAIQMSPKYLLAKCNAFFALADDIVHFRPLLLKKVSV
jgi:hypothetical protein